MVAAAAVDAGTVLIGTPTVLGGAHPIAVSAAYLLALLKPRTKWLGIFGSHGWAGKSVPHLLSLLEGIKCERLEPVTVKGLPKSNDFSAIDELAKTIIAHHATLGREA
jgi:flavorubredoxin